MVSRGHASAVRLSLPPQGFQVVCEATQSDSSSPAAGERSCRRGNSVEKGGPSQQPPPVKGPTKKKYVNQITSRKRQRDRKHWTVQTSLIFDFCGSIVSIQARRRHQYCPLLLLLIKCLFSLHFKHTNIHMFLRPGGIQTPSIRLGVQQCSDLQVTRTDTELVPSSR